MTKEGNLAELQRQYQNLLGLEEHELAYIHSLQTRNKKETELYHTGVKYFHSFVDNLVHLHDKLEYLATLKKAEAILDAGVMREARKNVAILLHDLVYDAELLHRVMGMFSRLDYVTKDDLKIMSKSMMVVIEHKAEGIEVLEHDLEDLKNELAQKKGELITGEAETDAGKLEKIADAEERLSSMEKHEENMFQDMLAISDDLKEKIEKFLGNLEYVKMTLSSAVATLNDFARVSDPNNVQSVKDFNKQTDALFRNLESEVGIGLDSMKKLKKELKKMHKYENMLFGLQVKFARKGDKEIAELKKAIRLTRQINTAKMGLKGL